MPSVNDLDTVARYRRSLFSGCLVIVFACVSGIAYVGYLIGKWFNG